MVYPYLRQGSQLAPRRQPRWYWLVLTAIALLGLALRAIGVARYPGLIYDEYYYVPAADVLLRRHPIALVKNMVPGIDPNLLSHPPVAKELIALAIFLFGQHAWVWRLPGVVLGAAVPLAVAGIAWELFHHRGISLLSAGLAALDGVLIVISRVALPDSPAVAFVMLALWMLLIVTGRLERGIRVGWLHWTVLGVLLGLGVATEWIGGQAILLVWLWFLVSSRLARKAFLSWVPATTLLPFSVYYASYFYAWPSGFHEAWLPANPFIAFFKLQILMFHDMWVLQFFHPWTASAWSWLGIPRPTAMILSVTTRQAIRVMAFPDPLVVWIGLAALAAGAFLVWRDRRFLGPWLFLLLWFLCFYGTWLMTPRSKFLYYFASASIGLEIAAGAGFVFVWEALRRPSHTRKLARGALITLGAVTVLTILYLLPLWVGIAVPPSLYQFLWPKSWNPRVKPSTASQVPSFSLTMNPQKRVVKTWQALAQPSAAPSLPSHWTMFRGSSGHNSVYAAPDTITQGYALQLARAGLEQAASVSGGVAFVGTDNNQVYAVNLRSGTVEWAVGVPNMVMTTPLIDQGLVIVGLGNTAFRTYSAKLGWIRGAGVNGLMAFNATTGHESWFHPTLGEAMATPVIFHQEVLEVTGASRLDAFSLRSGHQLWSLPLAGFDSSSSPVVIGNNLYVATNSYYSAYPARRSTVWDINLRTHQVVWSRNLPVSSGLSDCSIAVGSQTLFVAGIPSVDNNGAGPGVSQRIFALNEASGRIMWSRSLGKGLLSTLDQPEAAAPLVVDGVVYEGSPASNRVIAFSARSGRIVWSRRLSTEVLANLVLVGRTLVAAGEDGRLFAIDAKTGQVLGKDPYKFGSIGAASPLIVGNMLVQSTLTGQLVVQPLGH